MQEELNVPFWQMDIVRERLEDFKNNPDQAMDFDTAMDEIKEYRIAKTHKGEAIPFEQAFREIEDSIE